MAHAEPAAYFRGDEAPGVPELSPGWGALEVSFGFLSSIAIRGWGRLITDKQPNRDTWVPWPTVLLDGQPVTASWSTWWYPLPAGPHRIEASWPGGAQQLEVPAGQTTPVSYDATVVLVTDSDGQLLEWQASGEFTLRLAEGSP